MPSDPKSIIESYRYAVQEYKGPVVMLEHRLLYELNFEDDKTELSHPIFGSKLERQGSDITIIATSVMVLEAKRATNHLEKYNPSTTIDVLDKKAFDSIKDIEPIDTDITFTYLENDILSNNIEYQRDYLKSYDMHLCLYNVDASLRLPFLKYFFIIENNKRKFYTKSMDMRQFIDINENKHAIPPTDDDQDDDDQDISEIDQEFIRQITEFAKEKLRDDLDITNKYKGFIEDDNNNIFIFIEI
jgi:hypothetical protein